jgi:hypothetical protein
MLLDHFRPPLTRRRDWTGFHSHWASTIATSLNQQLPDGWFAEPRVQWGIEVDVGAFEEPVLAGVGESRESTAWQPPAPLKTIEFSQGTDVVEVLVHHDFGGIPVVGVIELVSPANKDRPDTREALVSKCHNYLRDSIGLIIVDVVADHLANLHALLMERVGEPDHPNESIYASAYRPLIQNGEQRLAIWYQPLELGASLPALPLFLKDGPLVRVDLAGTYRQA